MIIIILSEYIVNSHLMKAYQKGIVENGTLPGKKSWLSFSLLDQEEFELSIIAVKLFNT